MRAVAKHKAKGQAAYLKLRKSFLREHRYCEARFILRQVGHYRCQLMARDVHHSRGRGPHLCNAESFVAVCRCCHDFMHQHPGKARAVGLILPP